MSAEEEAPALSVRVDQEPITGWRCWFVLPVEGLLRPIYKRGLYWPPRQAQQAMCPELPHAETPDEACRCGIYAVCAPLLLNEVHWDHDPPEEVERLPGIIVVGQVALWGKVIQHDRGWRAQYAYPSCLYAFTNGGTRRTAS